MGSHLRSLKLLAHSSLFNGPGHSAQSGTGAMGAEPRSGSGLHSLLRQALPSLTVLTCLVVQQLPDACVLKYAPPQLQQLRAMGVGNKRSMWGEEAEPRAAILFNLVGFACQLGTDG